MPEIVDELSKLASLNWCWDKNTLSYFGQNVSVPPNIVRHKHFLQ